MSPLTLLLIGLLVGWIGLTDSYAQITKAAKDKASAGYVNIPTSKFIFGGAMAGAPLLLMQDDTDKRSYVTLILLMFFVVNYRGVETFLKDFSRLAKG